MFPLLISAAALAIFQVPSIQPLLPNALRTPVLTLLSTTLYLLPIPSALSIQHPSLHTSLSTCYTPFLDAEYNGKLKKGMTIIEPIDNLTLENGVAVAAIAAAKGYKCVLVMPQNTCPGGQNKIRRLGADIIHMDSDEGLAGALAHCEEIVEGAKATYFLVHLFTDESAVRMHEFTTAPELWDATGGRVDVLVAGVLSGATLTGTLRCQASAEGPACLHEMMLPQAAANCCSIFPPLGVPLWAICVALWFYGG